MNHNPSDYKFVVALNEKLESGVVINAASHMCLGLAAAAPEELRQKMNFITFTDANNNEHASISALSLVVLKGKTGELKKLRAQAQEAGLLVVDFVNTMTGDTYKEQLEKTRATSAEDLIYYGVAVFGEKAKIDPLTKRLSLWR